MATCQDKGCSIPTTEVQYPLVYYKFADVWDRLISPILDDPRVVAIRMWIVEEFRQQILKAEGGSTSNGDIVMYFLDRSGSITYPTAQREFIAQYGWARLSPTSEPEDKAWYRQFATTDNDNPKKFQAIICTCTDVRAYP